MPLYNTDAIALKSINLGEADKIVTFFTRRYGKIQGVAKGARRVKSRFGASLESLTCINLIYFGKENTNLYKINSCDIIESFHKCRDDFDKLKRGLFICDLVNSTVRELDVNLKIFDLFLNALRIIDRTEDTEKLDILIDIFSLRLLSAAGFTPKLNNCIYCNKIPPPPPLLKGGRGDFRIGFHILKGGIVCKDCLNGSEDSVRINYGIVNFMQNAIDISLSNLNRLSMPRDMERELHKLIRGYIHAHINKEIKSYSLLDL
ncbi:MAG: DNA repair protein RecO [Nitrospinae bacterium]|nr:DNA repair protein RecO [Nitrospinota bacterium]